jgi:hypothetical protein
MKNRLIFAMIAASCVIGTLAFSDPLRQPPETISDLIPVPQTEPAKGSVTNSLEVIPVLRLDGSSDMVVEAVFENTSSNPIGYLPDNDGQSVSDFYPKLSKDGKPLPFLLEERRGGMLSAKRVRKLMPGQGIKHKWSLKNLYGMLKPGRYDLNIVYDFGNIEMEKKYGITPLSVEQRMWLIVTAKNE